MIQTITAPDVQPMNFATLLAARILSACEEADATVQLLCAPETIAGIEAAVKLMDVPRLLTEPIPDSPRGTSSGVKFCRLLEKNEISGKSTDTGSVDSRTTRKSKVRTGSEMKEYITKLGRNIDSLRQECGWSFAELAKKTGFNKKGILGHVNEGHGARPFTVKCYADAFTKALNREITVAHLST